MSHYTWLWLVLDDIASQLTAHFSGLSLGYQTSGPHEVTAGTGAGQKRPLSFK